MLKLKISGLIFASIFISACKPDIPPNPVPLTKAISGIEAPCENLSYGGFPRKDPVTDGTYFICRDGYALNFNPEIKTPEWVLEHITKDNLSLPSNYTDLDDTRPDPLLAVKAQSTIEDFEGIGYEIAYFAPPGNFQYNDILYSHAHYLSNAFPQESSQKPIWDLLSSQIRVLANKRGELYVISGPLYMDGKNLGWVGIADDVGAHGDNARKGKIMVPTHVFKIIIDPRQKQSIGFIVPNYKEALKPSLAHYSVPVSLIERLTKVVFAPDLPIEQQRILKSQNSPQLWFN